MSRTNSEIDCATEKPFNSELRARRFRIGDTAACGQELLKIVEFLDEQPRRGLQDFLDLAADKIGGRISLYEVEPRGFSSNIRITRERRTVQAKRSH